MNVTTEVWRRVNGFGTEAAILHITPHAVGATYFLNGRQTNSEVQSFEGETVERFHTNLTEEGYERIHRSDVSL